MAGLSFIEGGEISGNVDNDMNVRFICKRRSSPISSFFPAECPFNAFIGEPLEDQLLLKGNSP